MIEREWFLPALLLTLTTCVIVFLRMPDPTYMLPALNILPAWLATTAITAAIMGTLRMAHAGEPAPLRTVAHWFVHHWRRAVSLCLVSTLAGVNLIGYLWFKPLLNDTVPFRADPSLAAIDYRLFLGHDPWTLLQWADVPFSEVLYHPLWLIMLIVVMVGAMRARATPEKSAALLTFFLLWTAIAPIIHTMMPAAGPLFYADLGYGPRFAGLHPNEGTRIVRDFLWDNYMSAVRADGDGISSMPSMHVTSMAWLVLATRAVARGWLPLALAAYAMIFLLSIALGWHYATDGIVGTVAAFATYRVTLAEFRRTHRIRRRRATVNA